MQKPIRQALDRLDERMAIGESSLVEKKLPPFTSCSADVKRLPVIFPAKGSDNQLESVS
ncbi:MAG TPA: hypothetical protein VFV38_08210 [Ktedonobacteraceae bacterium]|nr:hypothetical protein [Ktedonobacteraceae bacterium]